MKLNTKHIGLVLVVSVAIAALLTALEVKSQGNPHKTSPAALYVQYKPRMGPFTTNEYGMSREQIDLVVAYVSRSSNAPDVQTNYPCGELTAYMLGQGYQMQWLSQNVCLFTR